MITVKHYVKLDEVLSRALRHPLLNKQKINIEQAIQYAVDFIHIFGFPDMFEDKEVELEVKEHMAQLPCDCIQVIQVMNKRNGICMHSMTDSFNPTRRRDHQVSSHHWSYGTDETFKIQNSVIVTSFPHGHIKVAYRATAVDEDGYPLLIDNPVYLKALELYIKKEVFTYLFDEGLIKTDVLNHTEQQYAWAAAQLGSEMNTPTMSEMESLQNIWCSLVQNTTAFDNGFRHLGDREYIRRH